MKTVFVKTTDPDRILPDELIDFHFNNLEEFTAALRKS